MQVNCDFHGPKFYGCFCILIPSDFQNTKTDSSSLNTFSFLLPFLPFPPHFNGSSSISIAGFKGTVSPINVGVAKALPLALGPLLFPVNAVQITSCDFMALQFSRMLVPAEFLSQVLTPPLISRLIYSSAYWTFPHGYLIGISFLTCSKQHFSTALPPTLPHLCECYTQLRKPQTQKLSCSTFPYLHPHSKNKFYHLRSTSF